MEHMEQGVTHKIIALLIPVRQKPSMALHTCMHANTAQPVMKPMRNAISGADGHKFKS